MDGFRLLLCVVLLGWSAISLFIYQARRSDSKQALRDFTQQTDPIRQASDVELEQAYAAYRKRAISPSVYLIEGPLERHGLESHGNSTWHYLIGEIEIAPFPGWDTLLADAASAEVLRGPKDIALPVRFNGVSLGEALAQQARAASVEEQLRQGAIEASVQKTIGAASPDTPLVLRASRKETPAEASLRAVTAARGSGWALGVCAGLSLLVLATALNRNSQWVLGSVALILIAAAGFCLRRSLGERPRRVPGSICSLRGTLAFNEAVDVHGNIVVPLVRTRMGDLTIHYPPHWLAAVVRAGSGVRDIDVDLKHRVVRHERLSLYEELGRYPVVRWGWHMAMLVGAGVALIISLAVAWPLEQAMARASNAIQGTRHLTAHSPSELLEQQPRPGDWLTLDGSAQCLQSQDNEAGQDMAFDSIKMDLIPDCNVLGWNARPVPLAAPEPSADALALGALTLELGRESLSRAMASGYAYPDSRLTLIREARGDYPLQQVNTRVLQASRLCEQREDTDCVRLRTAFAVLTRHDEDWDATLAAAKAGTLEDTCKLNSDYADTLSDLLHKALLATREQTFKTALTQARQAYRAPLELSVYDQDGLVTARQPAAPNAADGMASATDPSDPLLEATTALLNTPFRIEGELSSIDKSSRGTPLMSIQARPEPPTMFAIFGPWALGMLSLLLLLVHAATLTKALARWRQRRLAVAQYVAQNLR